MVQEFTLEVSKRSELGKQAVKKLREEGQIPGIFYSAQTPVAIPFCINVKHLHLAIQSDSHVYAVSVGGKKLHAIFREIQYHPVTEEILHVDLFGVRLKDKITLMVPVILEGECAGVKAGGVLNQNLTEIQIRCLATEVPDAVHMDVTDMEIGDTSHIGDLDMGNIEVLLGDEVTIVSVQTPKVEIEVEEVEEEIEIEEEEGEEVEARPEGKEDKGKEDKGKETPTE